MKKYGLYYFTFFIALLFIITGCGTDYKKEIIGKWIAIENNCDESGICRSDEKVRGSTSYMPDGRMTAGDPVNWKFAIDGKYSIHGNKIKFILFINKMEIPGETEILSIKDNIMLSRTTLGTGMKTEGDETMKLIKKEPFIVKYKKEEK